MSPETAHLIEALRPLASLMGAIAQDAKPEDVILSGKGVLHQFAGIDGSPLITVRDVRRAYALTTKP
jgi:hypothetical protein